jgi:hypothetical protein
MRKVNYRLATVLLITAIGGRLLHARDKHPQLENAKAQDQIVVESHIALAASPITRFIVTRHYDRTYVYAVREAGKLVTLIDVTDRRHPRILSEAGLPTISSSLLAVAGTAALAGDASVTASSPLQTIRLMDFSDPVQPKIAKQFDNVTAVESVAGGVMLLANSEGIWILSQQFAEDPAVEKRYANKVVYGESMY